ncbi:hypothetical protein [Microcoleus sp. B9-D4]
MSRGGREILGRSPCKKSDKMVKANIHPRSEAVKNPKLILNKRSQ